MSYTELADQLKTLGKRLATESKELSGKRVAESAGLLKRALERFARELDSAAAGEDPDLNDFSQLLKNPSLRKHLDLDGLKQVAKDVLGRAFPSRKDETAGEYRKRLVEHISENGSGTKAVKKLREFLAEAASPAPQMKNHDALLAEIYRIGGLEEAEIEAEFTTRLRDERMLRALATAARLRVRENSSIEKIRRDLIRFAKRARRNIG